MSAGAPRGSPPADRPGFADMGMVTVFFGLSFALLEGLLSAALQAEPQLGWREMFRYTVFPQLTSAVVTALPAMLLLWLVLAGVGRLLKWENWQTALFGLLLFLLCVDLLDFTRRLRLSASLILALGLAVQAGRWFARRPGSFVRWMRWVTPVALAVVLLCTVGVWLGERAGERLALRQLPQAAADAPNVLLIVLDTARADYFSGYGYPRKTTPFLDSLAERGVRFEQAYAASSWTLPSHITVMTGRLPFEHTVRTLWGEIQAIDPRHPVLAEAFRQHGYATGGFVANPWYCAPRQGFSRGFLRYRDTSYRPDANLGRTAIGKRIVQYLFPRLGWQHHADIRPAGDINREFLDWLDGIGNRPLFAFLNYMDVHGPLFPPREFAARFSANPEALLQRKAINFLQIGLDQASAEMQQMELDAYAASLAYLDAKIEELFKELARRERHRKLLVVVTADHGEAFGERGLYGHRTSLYQSQIRVPLILSFPGRIPEGIRVSTPVGHAALAATLVELAGLPANPAFPGASLTAAWSQPGWTPAPVVLELDAARFDNGPQHWPVRRGWLKSLLSGRWQYILCEDGTEELFDLQADPEQSDNLADSPEGRVVAASLRRELERIVPEAKLVPRVTPDSRVGSPGAPAHD